MTLTVTLSLIALFAAVTVLTGWRGARPSDPVRGVRMIPWRFLMILSAAFCMLLVIHMFALLSGRG